MNKIPEHVGIIMDGNRRRAKEKGFLKIAGHKAGADNVKLIVRHAEDLGIRYLTLWALSKDNLTKRDNSEINAIINLIDNIENFLSEILEKGLKFEIIGDISKLPEKSQNILNKIKEKTKDNIGITLVLALVYNGRDEIERAYIKAEQEGVLPSNLVGGGIREYLDSGKFPDVDLIIRTGGDTRHSGFMLYSSEYAEYYYTDTFWPDFNNSELDNAINSFKSRVRRFGGN